MIHSLLEQRLNAYLFTKMVALHWAIVLLLTWLTDASLAAPTEKPATTYQIGAAAIDVTPDGPVRLRGYAGRVTESEGIVQGLWAKALVIKSRQVELLQNDLQPVSSELETRFPIVNLQLKSIPNRAEWAARATAKDAARGGTIGYHARIHLQRLDRGEAIKTRVPLPIQTWSFADDLAIIFLGGEVVVDYSLRLKKEFDHRRIWIIAYANDVPCYIPSERVLREGGYEGGGAMRFHDWAAPFAPGLENRIVNEIHYLLGNPFKAATPEAREHCS